MIDRGANIDLFFRNGLKDYEVLPPQDVWEGIRPALKKKHQSVILFRIAASVATIISLGAISLFLANNLSSDFFNPAITFNQDVRPEGRYIQGSSSANTLQASETFIDDTRLTNGKVEEKSTPAIGKYTLPEPGLFTSFIYNNKVRSQKSEYSSVSRGTIPDAGNPSGKDVLTQADLSVAFDNSKIYMDSRWSVGAMITPTYYSSVNLNNDDAAKEIIKAEESAVSYSGGFSVAYKLNKRFSVQTGVYYSSVGQKISGVSSYSGFDQYYNGKGPGQFSVVTSSGTITTGNNSIYLSDNNTGSRVITIYTADVFDPVKANLSYIDNSLRQNFNYLEIPFVLRYKLLDRNIDFNISGGISYNILVNNSAYATAGSEKYYIGKTSGLSPVTFSSSLGMGLEYSLSSKLSLNLEPNFRYYLTPLGGLAGSSIHPYSFGVLSGVSYRF